MKATHLVACFHGPSTWIDFALVPPWALGRHRCNISDPSLGPPSRSQMGRSLLTSTRVAFPWMDPYPRSPAHEEEMGPQIHLPHINRPRSEKARIFDPATQHPLLRPGGIHSPCRTDYHNTKGCIWTSFSSHLGRLRVTIRG